MKERLLVSMYGRKALDTIQVPDNAKIDQFMASRPAMFASRTRFTLEQLQFEMPSDPTRLKELESAHSLAEVGQRLTKLGINFQHGVGAMDSATIQPDALKRIEALPAGEPFIVPNGNRVVVSVITGREPVVVPADQARPLAVQALRAEELNKIGEQRLTEAKAKAKVEYQPGYEPPKAGAGTSAIQDATQASEQLRTDGAQ